MAHLHHTEGFARTEDAVTILFCLTDDAYAALNPEAKSYESIKRLSDSEVLTLERSSSNCGVSRVSARSLGGRPAVLLLPVPRGCRSSPFLVPPPPAQASALLGAAAAYAPSGTCGGEPETLIIDSTLLEVLHPRQVEQSARFRGARWVRWGSFAVYGVKLHLLCSTNRVPISYKLTAANVADVLLVRELLAGAGLGEGEVVRRLLGDLAYLAAANSGKNWPNAASSWLPKKRNGAHRYASAGGSVLLAALKRVFGMGETLAKTLTGLATRIAAKVRAYTYGCYINRLLGRPQGHIKELWA